MLCTVNTSPLVYKVNLPPVISLEGTNHLPANISLSALHAIALTSTSKSFCSVSFAVSLTLIH